MTPSMGMAAPKGTAPAAPQAGLAAIAQPATAPKGMTSGNMAQIMATARKMSDAQLAEVLQGRSLDVPQFVAMTEAMGRKQLRTAMGGAQAMAQAQQPSLKDKLLMGEQQQGLPAIPQQPVMAAEGGLMYAGGGAIDANMNANAGGIADLPAPNMEPMTMAGGGIVAFDEGGTAKERRDKALEALNTNLPEPVMPEDYKGTLSQFLADPANQKISKDRLIAEEAIKRNIPIYGPQTMAQNSLPSGSIFSAPAKAAAPVEAPAAAPAATLPPVDNSKLKPDEKGRFKAGSEEEVKAPAKKTPAAPSAGAEDSTKGLEDLYAAQQSKNRAAADEYYRTLGENSKAQREGLASIKSQGGGEALMQLAKGILSKSTLSQGVAEGLPGVVAAAAASRKEQQAITKDANDYDLNIAKAKEAMASGNMKAYNEYMQNADMAKYHGMVGKAALMNAGANQTAAGGDNKLNIAVGNKVMGDVQDRLKNDVRFRNEWSKMSPQEQAAYYQQQYNIASSVFSGKMNSNAFAPVTGLSQQQLALLNKYN